jgi:hypothetical protein
MPLEKLLGAVQADIHADRPETFDTIGESLETFVIEIVAGLDREFRQAPKLGTPRQRLNPLVGDAIQAEALQAAELTQHPAPSQPITQTIGNVLPLSVAEREV